MKIQTILVATDFSDDSAAALDAGVEFAKAFGAKLRIVHAYHVEIPAVYGGFGGDFVLPQDLLDPIRKSAESSMERALKDLGKNDIDVDGEAIMEYPSRAILDEAERLNADLIVMGTRGLTGIKHVIIGSTAERVVRLAECPVLTVKSKSEA